MNSIDDFESDSFRSSVSSPGMPKTCFTPSASRHSTNTSEAFLAAMPEHYPSQIGRTPRIASVLALVAAAAACAAPAATARRSELLRSGFASRSGELLHYLGYPVNVVAGPAVTPARAAWGAD